MGNLQDPQRSEQTEKRPKTGVGTNLNYIKKMKKLFVTLSLISLSTLMISCGGYMRGMTGATKKQLIETVSIKEDCPEENIEIISQARNRGGAVYNLKVCGENMVYEQIGTVFKKQE